MCADTHRGWAHTPTMSHHNIFDSGERGVGGGTITNVSCAPDEVWTSGLWIWSPTLHQLSFCQNQIPSLLLFTHLWSDTHRINASPSFGMQAESSQPPFNPAGPYLNQLAESHPYLQRTGTAQLPFWLTLPAFIQVIYHHATPVPPTQHSHALTV